MAKNHVKKGDTITLTAPAGGVVSGNLYIIGSLAIIAAVSAAAGEEFEGHTHEVWRLPKVAADVVAEGAPAYWDGTALTTTATDNDRVGYFAKAAGNGDEEAELLLCQLA